MFPKAKCPSCGKEYYGWALKYQVCHCECGCQLEVIEVENESNTVPAN